MSRKTFSEPYLKRLFNQFNRLYWGNRLPSDITVRWASARELKIVTGSKSVPWGLFVGTNPPTILLDQEIQKRGWGTLRDTTLLHEMCHLEGKGRGNHGPAFVRRMRRLATLGAFDKLW